MNNKNTIDDEIRVYQNSNGLITVNCSKRIVDRGIVSVYNAVGQKLYNKVLTNTSTILDKTLKSGVYMISVVSNGKTITRRVVLN